MNNRSLSVVLIGIGALTLAGCGKPPPPRANAISASEAQEIVSQSPHEIQKIKLGDRFMLLGVAIKKGTNGVALEFAWKSLAQQKLDGIVPIHILDKAGKTLANADYPQDKQQAEVTEQEMWRDRVVIPYKKLAGAVTIGTGVLNSDKKWLLADSGPRDWGNRRILVPLPTDIPVKPSELRGNLETADCRFIAGWLCDKAERNKVLQVEIYDGDQLLKRMAADLARPDLQRAGFGDGRHGFRFRTPAQIKDGQAHTIRVRAAGTGFELRNSPQTISCPVQ